MTEIFTIPVFPLFFFEMFTTYYLSMDYKGSYLDLALVATSTPPW